MRKHKLLSKPILACFLLILWGFTFYSIPPYFATNLSSEISNLLGVVASLLALLVHKLWFKPEYKGSFSNIWLKDKDILIIIIIAAIVDIATWAVQNAPLNLSLTFNYVTMALAAGFGEEMAMRALPISVMMRDYMNEKRIMFCAIFPSVLFGLVHFSNMYMGAALDVTIIQVVGAACVGVFLAALYLRTGNILLPIIYHAAHDLVQFLAQITTEKGIMTLSPSTRIIVTEGIMDITMLVLGLYLLRKSVRPAIIEIWKDRWNRE